MPTLTDLIPAPVAAKLDELARRYDEASHALEDPTVTADFKRVRELSIKRAAIEPVVGAGLLTLGRLLWVVLRPARTPA